MRKRRVQGRYGSSRLLAHANGQFDVLSHDGGTVRVQGEKGAVFENSDSPAFGSGLKSEQSFGAEAEIVVSQSSGSSANEANEGSSLGGKTHVLV